MYVCLVYLSLIQRLSKLHDVCSTKLLQTILILLPYRYEKMVMLNIYLWVTQFFFVVPVACDILQRYIYIGIIVSKFHCRICNLPCDGATISQINLASLEIGQSFLWWFNMPPSKAVGVQLVQGFDLRTITGIHTYYPIP